MCGYHTENEGDDYESFKEITVSTKNVDYMLEEAYTNHKMVCPDMMGVHDFKLKVDTGTSDNTIPTRIARDMYGNQWQSKAEPAKRRKLKACNGSEMKCFGTLKIMVNTRTRNGASTSCTLLTSLDQQY